MLITGNPFTDLLTYLTLALPLISVCFILFKKEYTDESLTLVMVLCLFYFIQRLLIQYNNLLEFSSPILHNLFNAIEFFLLVGIFKTNFRSRKFNTILNSFLIAYLSSTVTYFAIEGFNDDQYLLKMIQNGLMILLMASTIYMQVNRQQSMLMNTPLFWIAISTLFYFSFGLFWESGKEYIFNDLEQSEQLTQNFSLIAVMIRFGIYASAIWFLEPAGSRMLASPVNEITFTDEKKYIPAKEQDFSFRRIPVVSGRIV
jgi:hypothetical protein